MAKMGSPYLESGESLILTTDRVSVNTVQYDVLLTTRYLILVDVRYAQFPPQMIPLLTIQSVKGGKTANGELVITLIFADTGSSGKSESMVLLFSQQPGEQRKRERDDWLKTLMGLIVSVHQETSYDGTTTAVPELGIRPLMRCPNAPEIPHPYTKVVQTRPDQIELIVIPDEPESPVFSEERQELPEMSFPGERTKSEVTPAPCAMNETPGASPEVAGSPDTLSPPEVPIIVVSALVHEEGSGSQDTVTSVPAFEEIPGAPEADSGGQKSVTVSLLAAVKSLSSPKERTGLPDTGLPPLAGIEEPPVASPEDTVSPDLPASTEPVTVETPEVPRQDSQLAEPVPPEAGRGDESVQQPAPEATPQTPGSSPPSAGPNSRWRTIIAVAAIILIILGISGVIVFYPQNVTAPVAEPTPLPTQSVQLTLQATPQPTPVIIPATGVWVRVNYPHNYYGWVGNAGSTRSVAGFGDQIYKIPEIDGFVQVQIFKQDNSGDSLNVKIYRDGKVISDRTVSTPKSSIELLIDGKTGNPPGMTTVVTLSGNQTGSNSGQIMYF